MVKPRHHEIDWPTLFEAALEDGDQSAILLLKRAQLAFPEDDLTILTHDFYVRGQALLMKAGNPEEFESYPILPDGVTSACFQIENDPETGPAVSTMIYAEPPRVLVIPVDTGGCLMFDMERHVVYTPSAFRRDQSAEAQYALAVRIILCAYEFCREIPAKVLQIREVPSRRVVRKGKSVRLTPYRTVTIHPAGEVEATRRITERVAESRRRETPVEHDVQPHWVHYIRDEACDHVWQDVLSPDGKVRQSCAKCPSHRTRRDSFKRGDPNKPKKQTIKVVR